MASPLSYSSSGLLHIKHKPNNTPISSKDSSARLNKTSNTKSSSSVSSHASKPNSTSPKGEPVMSNNELLIAKGRLAELNESYNHLETRAEALLIQIRELLSPFSQFLDLDLEKVLLLAKEFRSLQLNARECLHMINKIKSTYNL